MDVKGLVKAKKKILIPLIFFVLMIGGFFYWWEFYETPPDKWGEAEYSPPEDYEVVETEDGVFVENKKAGISFKVPDGWRVEKEKYVDYIALFSPESKGTSFVVENGCKIKAEVRCIKANFQSIEKTLREGHKNWGYKDDYEIVRVDGYEGLKNTTGVKTLNQYYIGIYIPIKSIFKSKIYSLGLNANLSDKEECALQFEQFLKTVSIY